MRFLRAHSGACPKKTALILSVDDDVLKWFEGGRGISKSYQCGAASLRRTKRIGSSTRRAAPMRSYNIEKSVWAIDEVLTGEEAYGNCELAGAF